MQRWLVALLVLGMALAGLVSAVVVPGRQDAAVPPHLREGRWEMSVEGRQVRELVETTCGQLPDGVWVDRASPDDLPVLKGADASLEACFDEQVVPAMRGEPEL